MNDAETEGSRVRKSKKLLEELKYENPEVDR